MLSVHVSEVDVRKNQIDPTVDLPPGRFIKLAVKDAGHGIPAEVRDNVFDPFFTTKKRGQGTGMGLSVTHGIVKRLGGQIDFSVDTLVAKIIEVKADLPAVLMAEVESEKMLEKLESIGINGIVTNLQWAVNKAVIPPPFRFCSPGSAVSRCRQADDGKGPPELVQPWRLFSVISL